MAENSAIPWCHHTYNVAWGCHEVSEGCDNCYARTLAERYGFAVWGPPNKTKRRVFGAKHWAEPLKWNKKAEKNKQRARVFCSSMADVFEAHPMIDAERVKLWALIRATPWLDWLILTKRPERIAGNLPADWGPNGYPNVWLGTSVESQRWADKRIPALLGVPAVVYFLSCEPLLGPLDLSKYLDRSHEYNENPDGGSMTDCARECGAWAERFTSGPPRGWTPAPGEISHGFQDCPKARAIDWVIVGYESGAGRRDDDEDLRWASDIKQQCDETAQTIMGQSADTKRAPSTAFYFKQRGAFKPDNVKGVPARLMVRNFPTPRTAAA